MASQPNPTDEVGEKMISSSDSAKSLTSPSEKFNLVDASMTGGVTTLSTPDLARPSPPPSTPSSNFLHHTSQGIPHALVNELDEDGIMRDSTSLIHNGTSRCPHLEECMFPRFLSLDSKQMDDFCMGCVEDNPNVKSLGRIYIESLHLKEFLKDPQTIESEKTLSKMKASGKRLREPKPLPLSKRSPSSPSNQKVKEKNEELYNLSQAYFGGLEGRRAWFRNSTFDSGNRNRGDISGLSGDYSSEKDFNYRMTMPSSDELLEKSDELSASFPNDKVLPDQVMNAIPISQSSDNGDTTHLGKESIHASNELSPLANGCRNIDSIINSDASTSPASHESSNESFPKLKNVETPARVTLDPHSDDFNHSQLVKSNFDSALHEGKDAALKANQLLESFRCNRRKYWANKLKNNGKVPQCLWCPNVHLGPEYQFGVIRENVNVAALTSFCGDERSVMHHRMTGDSLIQCLECGLVGCAPMLPNKENGVCQQHAMLHFLVSGHRFGVTCGPLGEIFCMGCGDVVYHECFDQERERVFLEHNIPQLSWRETPIIRGIDPSSFIVTTDNQVIWQGIIASYPTPVSAQFVQASQLAAKRLAIFRGEMLNGWKLMGPKAMELFKYQHCHGNWLPVGIYNLGNTCSMSATLQCLIHCKPLRELFLLDLVHPYQSCSVIRMKSGKSSCLICEMDKAILEYYGSAVGIDTIAALEELPDLTSVAITPREIEQPQSIRGLPIIPSRLLAECWKNRGMKHVAGHAQHDAQEFFDAFLDCLAHHALAYHKSAQEMREVVYESRLSTKYQNPTSNKDLIKNIFTGTLMSVLVCQQCGRKRTQSESFSNVSLPLAKEFLSSHSDTRNIPRHGKISVDICLDHFTLPETLSDPVFCVTCDEKTVTMKQHTFSTLPEVLCLHLKRFNADKKITDFVAFPAHDLDMGKHLTHWREWRLDPNGESSEHQEYASNPQVLYDLFATVNHKGTLHQGHYTAYVKCGNCWYFCNDAFVTSAGAEGGVKEVLSSDGAYMLFYQKKKIMRSI